jgi:hypothetical protein
MIHTQGISTGNNGALAVVVSAISVALPTDIHL